MNTCGDCAHHSGEWRNEDHADLAHFGQLFGFCDRWCDAPAHNRAFFRGELRWATTPGDGHCHEFKAKSNEEEF